MTNIEFLKNPTLTPEEFLLNTSMNFLEFLDNRFSGDHAKSFEKYRFRGEQFKIYLWLFAFLCSKKYWNI